MATTKGRARLVGRFSAGTKVGLYERVGDFASFAGLGDPVKTAVSDDESVVEFTGLDVGDTFWVAPVNGAQPIVAVTAKEGPAGRSRQARPTGVQAQQTRGQTPAREIISGARGTKSIRGHAAPETPFADGHVGEPTPAADRVAEPQPAARQEDAPQGLKQMSSTVTGAATPTDPNASQPDQRQDEVPKGTLQRSDTELGVATPVERDEVQPQLRQEDAPKRLAQRSDTETGAVTPVTQDPLEVPGASTDRREAATSEKAAKRASKSKPRKSGETAKKTRTARKSGGARSTKSPANSSRKAKR